MPTRRSIENGCAEVNKEFQDWTNGHSRLLLRDARDTGLEAGSVHCVVTSPPYWGLRDYGIDGEGIGLEPTLSQWVENIVAVGREVWRVLRDDGTWWLNLGDAYAGSGKGPAGSEKQASNASCDDLGAKMRTSFRRDKAEIIPGKRVDRGAGSGRWGMGDTRCDLPAKNLMGQPWRAAFALQDDGWILRSAIVWHKPNPMPESVQDRPTNGYEMVFLLTKHGRYFYDAEAVRQPPSPQTTEKKSGKDKWQKGADPNNHRFETWDKTYQATSSNLRNVWTIPTQGRPEAHFATFPDELPRRCILAGTSEKGVCGDCGAPWVRVVEKSEASHQADSETKYDDKSTAGRLAKLRQSARKNGGEYEQTTQTLGWEPTCDCDAATVTATVLDPFVGSGTTVAVAQELGRRGVGTDLNPEYLAIARKRINRTTMPTMPMDLFGAGMREPVLDGDAYEELVMQQMAMALEAA